MIGGRFSLDREIGRGSSGAVWLGRDELLGRVVALKRIGLLPGADRTDLARAEREARLSARLNHPHVVAVFDVVIDTDSDQHWLVMEYIEGVTLDQLVRQQGALSPDGAAALMRQVADALVAAHSEGITHRDVKPSNILVDSGQHVTLTDFGIAHIVADPTLTQTGFVTGSPAYLAPEVATGSRGDEAADVWSFGATLFHLLAGEPPYAAGDHVLGALYRIVNEEPPRLDRAGWLAPVLEGTMVKDPSRRWSMMQVRDFLDDPAPGLVLTAANHPEEPAQAEPAVGTRVLSSIGPTSTSETSQPPPTDSVTAWRPRRQVLLAFLGILLPVVLALALYGALPGREPALDSAESPADAASSREGVAPDGRAEPSAEGMESFIRDYVATVASDPAAAWQMLTPKFQRESGGFDAYRRFWDRATDGRVRSIFADPRTLMVRYRVKFDNFSEGRGPTVLLLKFDDGRYLINGERTRGFVPAG